MQYACSDYTALLLDRDVQISMAAMGKPEENGYAERLMRTIKEEEVDLSEYTDFHDAYGNLGRFLDKVYTRKRIHSALGYLTPAEFEARWLAQQGESQYNKPSHFCVQLFGVSTPPQEDRMKNTLTPPKIFALTILVFIGTLLVGYGVSHISAQDPDGNPVNGGLLYDKWWVVTGADAPTEDHPLWASQSTNTRTGADTWRCKECHGWDYKGAAGAYGSGSHFTGFPGILDSKGRPVEDIVAALKGSTNPDHDFSTVMDDQALLDLAVFISETLIDTDPLINKDKTATGDAVRGEAFFGMCIGCHGPEGNAIYFGSFDAPEVIGGLASGNPWEFLHKARYGQPGWPSMPAMQPLGLSDTDFADFLAYVQTLPAEPALSGGGLLYDKWWVVTGADAPTEDHPLWATQSTNTRSGADTWRCKECHGWDYKGAAGAYGSGSHFTGFPGILDATSLSSDELRAWLNGEANPDHDFSAVMDEVALDALVVFIQQEMLDTSVYVNSDKTVNGDPDAGKPLFAGACARCHGADGKTYNFGTEDEPVYIGTLANDNPLEVFHKAAYGQPGQPMPGGLALGWTPQEIADVVAYTQTLPVE